MFPQRREHGPAWPPASARLLASYSAEVPMRRTWLAVALIPSLAFAPLATVAQQPPSTDSRPFQPEELEHIVAPIALYPDSLLAQIFKASTYPPGGIQAAGVAKANANLKGDALNAALKNYKWAASVKTLVSSPQVLERMDRQLEWMQQHREDFAADR